MDESVTNIFNRHIGKAMTLLEASGSNPELKTLVRKQMWFLHDDVQSLNDGSQDGKENFNK